MKTPQTAFSPPAMEGTLNIKQDDFFLLTASVPSQPRWDRLLIAANRIVSKVVSRM